MGMFLLAVVESGVDLFGHDAVFVEHGEHIGEAATLREVDLAPCAHILSGLVDITVAHRIHLRQIQCGTALTQHLLLERRYAGECPACARFILILYRVGGEDLDVGELKSGAVGGDHTRLRCRSLHISRSGL